MKNKSLLFHSCSYKYKATKQMSEILKTHTHNLFVCLFWVWNSFKHVRVKHVANVRNDVSSGDNDNDNYVKNQKLKRHLKKWNESD